MILDTDETWKASCEANELSVQEVHVWKASLDQPEWRLAELESTLSPDEATRARNRHFVQDRQYFIAARGFLREILGRYLGTAAGEVGFSYGPYGKPAVVAAEGTDLCFNLSHCQELVLYAIAKNRRVGVDLERVRTVDHAERIAERFFSVSERESIAWLPDELKMLAFFNCWTRKEAYLKAVGRGLSLPFGQVEVSSLPSEPARLLSVCGNSEEAGRWSLTEIRPADGYVSTLAVEGDDFTLKRFSYGEA